MARIACSSVGNVDSLAAWIARARKHARERVEAPRTAWQALADPGFLLSPWPWRSLAYLGTGVVFGAGAMVLLFSLIAVGLLLSPALVGIPVLAAISLAGLPLGTLERHRIRWVSHGPLPDSHAAVARPGFVAWLRFRLSEQATWRELGYAFMLCLLLWPIDLAVLFAGVLFPLGTLYGAVTTIVGLNHDIRPLPGWTLTSTRQALVVAPLALLGLLLGAYLVALVAGARAAFTRLVIGRREGENDARLLELIRSRARLVDAFEAERRRIERDLHDGAQVHLVALTMTLGLARRSNGQSADGPGVDGLLAKAQDQAKQALRDLRELIQGIHPQILTDRGLPAAVADIADRATVPVTTAFELPARLPQPVEAMAYFAICEALANVAKHSGADRAEIRGWLAQDRLLIEVRDNGIGGANASAGTGLAGLADRLSVLDGRLLVASPPGGPTLLRAEIPVNPDDLAPAG
jgi:signal transduction histidine kinase